VSASKTENNRKPRADRRRNRERIVTRTAQLYAREGDDVPMERIAEHAGVGVGTLYRHFPDRAALTQGVARFLYEEIAQLVRSAEDQEPDAWDALIRLIRDWTALRLAVSQPLDEWLTQTRQSDAEIQRLHAVIVDFLDRNIAAAQSDRRLRGDVDKHDIVRLIGLLVQAEAGADRLVEIAIDGLHRPRGAPVQQRPTATRKQLGSTGDTLT